MYTLYIRNKCVNKKNRIAVFVYNVMVFVYPNSGEELDTTKSD